MLDQQSDTSKIPWGLQNPRFLSSVACHFGRGARGGRSSQEDVEGHPLQEDQGFQYHEVTFGLSLYDQLPDSDVRETYDLLMSSIVKRIKLDREKKTLAQKEKAWSEITNPKPGAPATKAAKEKAKKEEDKQEKEKKEKEKKEKEKKEKEKKEKEKNEKE